MTCFGFCLAFGHLSKLLLFFLFLLIYVFEWWCWQCTHQGGDCEHKVDLFLVVRVDDGWLSTWVVLWLSRWTNHKMSCVLCDMSLSLWCVGVEHKDGGRYRRWRSCGFMPMDRERWKTSARIWPIDHRSRMTSCGGWHLRHTPTRRRMDRSYCWRSCRPAGHVSKTWGMRTRCATDDNFGGWVTKPHSAMEVCFHRAWASKLYGAVPTGIEGSMWFHCEGCVEVRQLHVERMPIRCIFLELVHFVSG
jgi:hypothetical protein